MEHISKILNPVSQGIGPLEHLPTLKKEIRTCSCGNTFTAFIKVVDDKVELDGLDACPACQRKVREEEWKQERLAKIPEARRNQRWQWHEECNLQAKFGSSSFENFERKLQPKAYDAVNKYNYQWTDDEPPHSLVLLSPDLYGVGKTHLVAALLNKIIKTEDTLFVRKDGSFRREPCPVYFTAENTLLSRIRQTFNLRKEEEAETEEDVYKQLEKVDLLVIDDVGKVKPRDYSFLQGVYFRIIDYRYSNEMPIILTTNLSFTELENHIGGACADRLREMCGDKNFIVMKGTSYRKKMVLS